MVNQAEMLLGGIKGGFDSQSEGSIKFFIDSNKDKTHHMVTICHPGVVGIHFFGTGETVTKAFIMVFNRFIIHLEKSE